MSALNTALTPEELASMNSRSKQLQSVAANIMHQSGAPFKQCKQEQESRYNTEAARYYTSTQSEQVQQCLRLLIDTYVRPPLRRPEHYTYVRYFNSTSNVEEYSL